jgi:mono/diheme cytochrome c family protein
MTIHLGGRWLWFALGASVLCTPASGTARQASSSPAAAEAQPAAFVQQYCLGCHNDRSKTAGLSLQGLSLDRVPEHAAVWEKALRKLRSGEMPPATVRVRPTSDQSLAVASFLEATLDEAARAKPNPGRATVHRLNRAEYSNAVRDLLAVDVQPGNWLPVDDSGYGFDNIGAVLSTSPVLIERYLSAARRVSRMAIGDPSQKPYEDIYTAPRDPFKGVRNERVSDALPFNSRAGISVEHYFPVDAEYVFKVRFRGLQPTTEIPDPNAFEVRLAVPAGLHTVGVTSPRENTKAEIEGPGIRAPAAFVRDVPTAVDVRLDGRRVKRFDVPAEGLEIGQLMVGGPYNVTGRGVTPSRARIFICPTQDDACARTILTTLARRAFRRAVSSDDVEPLVQLYRAGRKGRDFEAGIQNAVQALLTSPEFLFRAEQDPPKTAPGSAYRVSSVELASRLSFFLWSSIPDDELLDLAIGGKLSEPAVLERQVRRMLQDRRAEALVTNFAGQWLHLRNVETVQPDPVIFPFDAQLRQAFGEETRLLFASIVREDRSMLDLLRADYTYLNQRLAEHYGVSNVYGSQFRRVAVSDPNRRGLLGHGSVLTLTSYPNRTSVVQRGKWVLENLLGTPPPPPPPDVPELQSSRDGKKLTMREQMEAHRASPVCSSCHARMDPIGFALENYDGVGKWRTDDAGAPIDARGTLPDGTVFQGGAGLTELLLTRYKDDVVRTATEKLLTYALGRGVDHADAPAVRTIAREAAAGDYRFSALVLAVIKSMPFQMRRAES